MKVAIISSGFLPIPSRKGGAVENLVENIIKKNELYGELDIDVYSSYDTEAMEYSRKYVKSKFYFFKESKIVDFVDRCIFFFFKNILKRKNSHSYRFILRRLIYLRKVSKKLNENDYDKVILENHLTQFFALKWKKNSKKYRGKYYYHCHNEVGSSYTCEEIMKNTEKFICISDFIRTHLMNKFSFINNDNTAILKNCIDIDKYTIEIDRGSVKEKYGIDNKKKIIVYTGRLIEEKGIMKLVDSLEYLKTKEYQLVIVGGVVSKINFETTFTKKLKEKCEKYNENVIFTGYVEYEKMNEIYKIADVVVLPSIWEEPAGLTMLEAMASGAPLITTDVGGITEYIKEDVAIILKNDENLEKNIAKNIDKIFEDELYKDKICKNGYKYAREYNLDSYYKNFVEILKSGGK